jgi:hypothetical protein
VPTRAVLAKAFAAIIVTLALPFVARAASDLAVLAPGRYACWTAGVASGPAVSDRPERSFTIVRGSSYESAAGRGTYLLAGDLLTFTRGPFKDQRLRRTKDGFWPEASRLGVLGSLKCSRAGVAPLGAGQDEPSAASVPDRD